MKFTTLGSIFLMTLVSMTSAGAFWAGRKSVPISNDCAAAHVHLCEFKPGDMACHRFYGWEGVVTSINGTKLRIRFTANYTSYLEEHDAAEWKHEDCR